MKGIFIIEYSKSCQYYEKPTVYKKQYIDAENILSLEHFKETRSIQIEYKSTCSLPTVITDVNSVKYYSDYEANVNVSV